jgi:hypothetical protein
MRSEVLMAKMLMLVFYVVTPCGLVDKYRCFGGLRQPSSALKMEAVCSFETLVST